MLSGGLNGAERLGEMSLQEISWLWIDSKTLGKTEK